MVAFFCLLLISSEFSVHTRESMENEESTLLVSSTLSLSAVIPGYGKDFTNQFEDEGSRLYANAV